MRQWTITMAKSKAKPQQLPSFDHQIYQIKNIKQNSFEGFEHFTTPRSADEKPLKLYFDN